MIPQAMAYGTVAGLPVQVGLHTCIAPMIVCALLGGARRLSMSTTSTIVALTGAALAAAGVASSLVRRDPERDHAHLRRQSSHGLHLGRDIGRDVCDPALGTEGAGTSDRRYGGIAAVLLLDLGARGVALIPEVPRGLPTPAVPPLEHIRALAPFALAIAMMAFLDSVSVARATREPFDPPIDNNRELVAVGMASLAGSFLQAVPAAGGFSQTLVNAEAGAPHSSSGIAKPRVDPF